MKTFTVGEYILTDTVGVVSNSESRTYFPGHRVYVIGQSIPHGTIKVDFGDRTIVSVNASAFPATKVADDLAFARTEKIRALESCIHLFAYLMSQLTFEEIRWMKSHSVEFRRMESIIIKSNESKKEN